MTIPVKGNIKYVMELFEFMNRRRSYYISKDITFDPEIRELNDGNYIFNIYTDKEEATLMMIMEMAFPDPKSEYTTHLKGDK